MAEPVDAVLHRAAGLVAAGSPHKAIGLLRPLVVTDPTNGEAWCRLASAHLGCDEPEAAASSAKEALRCGADPAWANRLRAYALRDLDRHDESIAAAREAVRCAPDDWRALVALATVLGASDPAEALPTARHATRVDPSRPRTHEVLGDLAVRAGDIVLAERSYRESLRLEPGDDQVRAALARLAGPRALPEPPRPGTRTAIRGRDVAAAARVAWQACRTLSSVSAGGCVLLLLAGMPRPSAVLGWVGVALLLVLAGVAITTLLFMPGTQRAALPLLPGRSRALALAMLLLASCWVIVATWSVVVLLGGVDMSLPGIASLTAVISGVLSVMARVRGRYRDHHVVPIPRRRAGRGPSARGARRAVDSQAMPARSTRRGWQVSTRR